jgi:hypothetical protein
LFDLIGFETHLRFLKCLPHLPASQQEARPPQATSLNVKTSVEHGLSIMWEKRALPTLPTGPGQETGVKSPTWEQVNLHRGCFLQSESVSAFASKTLLLSSYTSFFSVHRVQCDQHHLQNLRLWCTLDSASQSLYPALQTDWLEDSSINISQREFSQDFAGDALSVPWGYPACTTSCGLYLLVTIPEGQPGQGQNTGIQGGESEL